MTEPQFWRSTPYLTRLHVEAYHQREQLAFRRTVAGAWYTEAFARQKRLPKLETILDAPARPKRRQTPDEMLMVAESIVAAFGGLDLRPQAEPA